MKRAKGQLQSNWAIGLTMITIACENGGLQPYWKRIETELYALAARHKDDPRKLRNALEYLAVSISRL